MTYILASDGILNKALGAVGYEHEKAWFYQQSTALPSIIGMNAWTTSGTIMLFYLAALRRFPPTSTRRRRSTVPARGGRSARSPSRC